MVNVMSQPQELQAARVGWGGVGWGGGGDRENQTFTIFDVLDVQMVNVWFSRSSLHPTPCRSSAGARGWAAAAGGRPCHPWPRPAPARCWAAAAWVAAAGVGAPAGMLVAPVVAAKHPGGGGLLRGGRHCACGASCCERSCRHQSQQRRGAPGGRRAAAGIVAHNPGAPVQRGASRRADRHAPDRCERVTGWITARSTKHAERMGGRGVAHAHGVRAAPLPGSSRHCAR
jgi:hypothetical protein